MNKEIKDTTESLELTNSNPLTTVMTKNIPYVKEYNELGEVSNPITPSKPYLNKSPYNRRQRRALGLA